MNKGEVSTILALGIVTAGAFISLAISLLISKKPSLVSNPKAVSCLADQCVGAISCYPTGHFDANSGLTCCAAFTNCKNTGYSWATWGNSCSCTASTPTPTNTPAPTSIPTTTPPPSVCLTLDQTCDPAADNCCQPDLNCSSIVKKCIAPIIPLTPFASLIPSNTPTPPLNCIANGNNCSASAPCCSGYCQPSSGFCWPQPPLTSTPVSTPTTTPTPAIPPAQACKRGTETYSQNQTYCDEQNNVVKECLGSNQWQTIIPHPCGGKCTDDPTGHAYSCTSFSCEDLEVNGSNKLKVAFIPENWSSLQDFKEQARQAKERLRLTNLKPLVNKMNFYIVTDLSQKFHFNNAKGCNDVDHTKIYNVGQSACGADKSMVIDNPSYCEICGQAIIGLSAYVCHIGLSAVPHEFGHAIALLDDEYVYTWPITIPNPGVNCSDKKSSSSSTPCSKWKNTSNLGCYKGCTYDYWYRPTENSIMRYETEPEGLNFNAPSLKSWEDILNKYN